MNVTAANHKPVIRIHCFDVNGVKTFMVEPLVPVHDNWYQTFSSKPFDTLEETMREVVALQLQVQARPSVYV
jgi:hypothetical protein